MNKVFNLLSINSLKWRLRFFIINLILLVVLIISTFLIIMTKSQLNETFHNQLSAIVNMQGKSVEKWLNERELDIKYLASDTQDKNIKKLFESFIQNQSEFYSISYVDTNGYTLIDSTFDTKHYFGNELFFKDSLEGIDTISEVSISKDAKMPIIYFSSPVIDEYGDVKAIVVGAVRLSSIQNIVEDFRFSETGETFIVNNKGQLLTKRRFEKDYLTLKIIDNSKMKNDFYENYSKEKVLGTFSKIHFDRWTIVAQISTQEMYKVYEQFILYVFIFAAALVLLIIPIVLSFSNIIEEPLKVLLLSSKKIEDGNYGHTIDSQAITNSTLEIKELTHSFNSMSEKLNDVIGKLKINSTIDSLSQLNNRRELLRISNERFNKSLKENKHFSILMIDIDFFKKINDNYGHRTGDVAISMVASSIKSSISSTDVAGRYGGEEFLVFIEDAQFKLVEEIAQRIRTNIEKLEIINDKHKVTCTCSIGLFLNTKINYNITLEEAIEFSDQALYEAKHTGRNKVIIKTNGSGINM